MTHVAVIGAGLIGRAWCIVFARAGFQVALWDKFPQQTTLALSFIADRLPELRAAGLLADAPETVLARIEPKKSLWDAVRTADYIQENGPERIDVKTAVFTELERAARPDAVIASSTSGIPASAFTEHLKTRHRCLIAHPVNPPYLIPLVEICPSPWTDPAVTQRTREIMVQAGQVPATVKKEIDGFALNRLQGALVAEAFRLLADDVISPADLDALVKHGIGLALELHGAAGDDRPERARRPGGLLQPLRRAVCDDAGADEAARLGEGAGGPPACRAPGRTPRQHAARPAGMARSAADGAAGAQGGAAGLGCTGRPAPPESGHETGNRETSGLDPRPGAV